MLKLLTLTCVGLVSADIKVSRTVDTLAEGNTFELLASPGCATTDQYGSNDCDFHWGQELKGSITAKLGQDLDASAQIHVDLKVNGFIPFKFDCPVCGDKCSIKIPIVEQSVDIPLPPCPIAAGDVNYPFDTTLPGTSPLPLEVQAKGTASVTAGDNTILKLTIDASASKNAFDFQVVEAVNTPLLGANGHGLPPAHLTEGVQKEGESVTFEKPEVVSTVVNPSFVHHDTMAVNPKKQMEHLFGNDYDKSTLPTISHTRLTPAAALKKYHEEHNTKAYIPKYADGVAEAIILKKHF